MKYVAIIILGFMAGTFFQWSPILNGDMNRDGVLDITDLSILASIINEQG